LPGFFFKMKKIIQNQNDVLIKEAKEFFNKKLFEESKRKLEKLSNPTNKQKIHKDVIISAILVRSGNPDGALALIAEVEAKLQKGIQSEETINIKTVAYRAKNELDKAVNLLQEGLEVYPNSIDLAHNLSVTAADLGNLKLAEEAALLAIKINPRNIETYKNLGRIYVTNRSIDKARDVFNALENLTSIENVDVLVGKGAIELMQSNASSAAGLFKKALEIDDSLSAAWSNLGICYKYLGDYQNAKVCLQNAIQKDPLQIEHQWNLSLVNLALGNFVEGWSQYEVRYSPKRITPDAVKLPTTQIPMLNPSDSIVDKTVILVQEQGYGDTFQFFRFSKNLKDEGAKKIIAIVSKEMAEIVRTIPWIDEICTEIKRISEPLDFWIFSMSLPLRYKLDSEEKIPSYRQYISVDRVNKKRFEGLLSQKLKKIRVGLVWAGRETHSNDSNRSLSFKLLEPLLEMHPDIDFVSLQKGPREVDAISDARITSYGANLNNFADTAALLSNLDLLISVDSSPVHLAGALGMPVWTLIPSIYDFRWMVERENSPWYPSMRLFRQKNGHSWDGVISQVKRELANLVKVQPTRWSADEYTLYPPLAFENSTLAGAPFYLNCAFQYHTHGDLASAKEMYQKCLAYEPKSLDALRNLAALLRNQGELREAELLYIQGHNLGIGDPIFYTNYANLLMQLGRYNEALIQAREALRQKPQHQLALAAEMQCMNMINQANVNN